jgi:GDP-4-dehydro-6-deoxy-D-mannose reductase
MPPRRILVTGANGFVGRHLVPQLRAAFPAAALTLCAGTPDAEMRLLDVTDTAAVDRLVTETRPDACVHLAAIAAIPAARRDPVLAWRVNLHGTLALATALLRDAAGCVLLFPSSADAYGGSFRAGRALDETAPLAPLNTYAATKAAADLALGALAGEGLRVIRVRPFNHTGPGQSADFVVPAFARQVARIEAGLQAPVLDVGALDPLRDFLDVRDVCAAYVAVLARAEALSPGTILNVASGTPRRIGDVLDALVGLAGIRAGVATGAARLRPTDIPTASGDAAAARAALGWAPSIAWERTLGEVLADWRVRVREG